MSLTTALGMSWPFQRGQIHPRPRPTISVVVTAFSEPQRSGSWFVLPFSIQVSVRTARGLKGRGTVGRHRRPGQDSGTQYIRSELSTEEGRPLLVFSCLLKAQVQMREGRVVRVRSQVIPLPIPAEVGRFCHPAVPPRSSRVRVPQGFGPPGSTRDRQAYRGRRRIPTSCPPPAQFYFRAYGAVSQATPAGCREPRGWPHVDGRSRLEYSFRIGDGRVRCQARRRDDFWPLQSRGRRTAFACRLSDGGAEVRREYLKATPSNRSRSTDDSHCPDLCDKSQRDRRCWLEECIGRWRRFRGLWIVRSVAARRWMYLNRGRSAVHLPLS